MMDSVTVDVLNYSNYMQVQVYAQGRISSSIGNWQQLLSCTPVLFLLVKVPLIVFLHYGLYVDVFLPLSQLVALGKNHKHY